MENKKPKVNNYQLSNNGRRTDVTVYQVDFAKGVVIISPAMGVKQQFYRELALYLNSLNYHVITFDYYGMLLTNSDENVEHNNIADFGLYDLTSVIDLAESKFKDYSLFLIGHSVAGQIFPLATNANKISAACFVASQQVSKKYWSGLSKFRINLFWHLLLPMIVRVYGFLPGYAYGGKYRLQKTIALDWAAMAKTKEGIYGKSELTRNSYKNCRVPCLFISLANDDLLAPVAAVKALLNQYGSKKEYYHIPKSSMQDSTHPHFDFFRLTNIEHWNLLVSFFIKNQNGN